MPFIRETGHILTAALLMLALIGLAAAYWALSGEQGILQRSDNPRRIAAQARIQRGSITDRDARPLAHSIQTTAGLERQYPQASAYSLVGYASLRYGLGGAEAAFDAALSGAAQPPSLASHFATHILHIPPTGADVRLTVDLAVQGALARAMTGEQGAAVVLDAQSGAVLALVSLPSYDPNTLDADWDRLRAAEGEPFFNRALQGQYQPGSMIYTLWLAAAVLAGEDLTRPIENARAAIDLGDGITAACVIEPAQPPLSLRAAFIYGCPAPFAAYYARQPASAYAKLIQTYRLDQAITLPGFPAPEPIPPAADDWALANPALAALRDALGQGDLTVNPLHISSIMAAIANHGNAPLPHLQAGLRAPDSREWLASPPSAASLPMMTSETAAALQNILQGAWATLQDASVPPAATVGAHITLSQSGSGTQIGLNGFVAHSQQSPAAFAILLENTRDIAKLTAIGQVLIAALLP